MATLTFPIPPISDPDRALRLMIDRIIDGNFLDAQMRSLE